MINLTLVEEALYIALYMLFFLLDDLIVFFIAVRTMQLTGFSTKYGKIAKIVGGILLFIIGIVPIVNYFKNRLANFFSSAGLLYGIFSVVAGLLILFNTKYMTIKYYNSYY